MNEYRITDISAGHQESFSVTVTEDMMAKFKKDSDEKISVLKKSTDFKGGGRRGKP